MKPRSGHRYSIYAGKGVTAEPATGACPGIRSPQSSRQAAAVTNLSPRGHSRDACFPTSRSMRIAEAPGAMNARRPTPRAWSSRTPEDADRASGSTRRSGFHRSPVAPHQRDQGQSGTGRRAPQPRITVPRRGQAHRSAFRLRLAAALSPVEGAPYRSENAAGFKRWLAGQPRRRGRSRGAG